MGEREKREIVWNKGRKKGGVEEGEWRKQQKKRETMKETNRVLEDRNESQWNRRDKLDTQRQLHVSVLDRYKTSLL